MIATKNEWPLLLACSNILILETETEAAVTVDVAATVILLTALIALLAPKAPI